MNNTGNHGFKSLPLHKFYINFISTIKKEEKKEEIGWGFRD
jgi:hypothetical protein